MTIYSSMGSPSTILSSLASLIPQLLMSSLENGRKSFKKHKTLVPHFLLLLPAVPHSMFMSPANLPALYLKGWVRTPRKVKRCKFNFKKLYLWLILEHSRRFLDVDSSLPDGACIPILKELIA